MGSPSVLLLAVLFALAGLFAEARIDVKLHKDMGPSFVPVSVAIRRYNGISKRNGEW